MPAADAPAPVLLAIPLDAIDATALIRDRTGLDQEPFTALKRSVLATGLRSPVEVFPLAGADRGDGARYGLIAGYRRLLALRALREDGHEGFDSVPALVRDVAGAAEACRLMVEENAIRADVSIWEAARLAVIAAERGIFTNAEAAIERLHPTASRHKQARLRRIAHLVEALDGVLAAPETLSERQLLRLAGAMEAGFHDPILLALEGKNRAGPERQWAAVLPLLAEHEAEPANPAPRRPGRPRRAMRIRDTLAVRRERTGDGYVLRFSGKDATSALLDTVLDQIEQMFSPA